MPLYDAEARPYSRVYKRNYQIQKSDFPLPLQQPTAPLQPTEPLPPLQQSFPRPVSGLQQPVAQPPQARIVRVHPTPFGGGGQIVETEQVVPGGFLVHSYFVPFGQGPPLYRQPVNVPTNAAFEVPRQGLPSGGIEQQQIFGGQFAPRPQGGVPPAPARKSSDVAVELVSPPSSLEFQLQPSRARAMPSSYGEGQTIGRRDLSASSLYDLQDLPNPFVDEGAYFSDEKHEMRDFSAQSLEDLRRLPSISSSSQTLTARAFEEDDHRRMQYLD